MSATDLTAKLDLLKEHKLPTAVLAADADETGQKLFAACFDGGIYQVAPDTGAFKLLAKHNSYASGVRHLRKTGALLSAGYDGRLIWTDLTTSKQIRAIAAHKFWSWNMDLSPDEKLVATVTGQYLAGGYKYEPAPEQEPCVKVFDTNTGELRAEFSHLPPVLSVAFTPDGTHLAAANMMGEIRIWNLAGGKQVAAWTTPDFTSWGIIKSHHYIGGIFDLAFTPDGRELLACGMGPMRDPMAGNGKQTWQRFAWAENPPRKVSQIKEADSGSGLMERLQFHPDGKFFAMTGRLAQGKWNTALFDSKNGELLHSLDTKMRTTDAIFLPENRLLLAGATSQEKKKDGKYPDFGRFKVYRCSVTSADDFPL